MKFPRLLLFASLAANAVLVALLLLRPAPAPSIPGGTAVPAPRVTSTAKGDAAIIAALSNGDDAALAAAGVPADVINHLAAARAFGRLAAIAREQDQAGAAAPDEYWRRNRNKSRARATPEQRAARAAAEREFEAAMRKAFGEEPFGDNDQRRRFLSEATRERLRRIERDYDEMRQDLSRDADGFQLTADRERLRLLESEKERDIAALLSPAERESMALRTSNAASHIIQTFGDILTSEEEYKRLYALRKAFEDRYNSPEYNLRVRTPEENRLRAEAERRLHDELRTVIGEERWATFPRENDQEYRSLNTLATRLGLPAAVADQIYTLRDSYAAQSAALNQNTSLSDTDRRAQLADLANRAKAELRAKLGPDGAEAYTPRANWLQLLQNGSAFTTDARQLPAGSPRPNGNQTAFPLSSPRPNPQASPGP